MLKFDKETNTLVAYKVEEPDLGLDLLKDQKASYNMYLKETVKEDMEVLCNMLMENFTTRGLTVSTEVLPLYTSGFKREIKKQRDKYYPVQVTFTIGGVKQKPFEILRIPYMDEDGILNINGERRVLLMQMSASEDVSYTKKNDTLNVAMYNRNIAFIAKPSGINIKFGNASVQMHEMIRAMLIKRDIDLDLEQYFSNAHVVWPIIRDKLIEDETVEDNIDKLRIIETYEGDKYKLGKTRNALNRILTIDRCLMRTLNRPVLKYGAGTLVTPDVLQDFKRNMVNEVYVRAVPNIAGYRIAQDFFISTIPAGTPNSSFLKSILPEYALFSFIPKDTEVNLEVSGRDQTITEEQAQFFYDLGLDTIQVKRTKDGDAVEFRFEQEIIGNYTCKLSDVLGSDIPAGREADEYVYFYDNPRLKPNSPTHITVHDLMAIYSLTSYIYNNPDENDLLDKDTNFLKRVSMHHDVFSTTLRQTFTQFLKQYKTSIGTALTKTGLSQEVFRSLTKMWTTKMFNEKFTTLADLVNPIATLAQVSHIVANLQGREPPTEMRMLAMGYYGRICPYETPSSQKLGITNTKAIGSRVVDSMLETPYQRVIRNSRGEITGISPAITWMTVKEEASFRIGDKLSLIQDASGKYINNRVIARVPAPGNQVTVETIDAFQLQYVNAHCEQHLSPTAMLVPFACSNDAVRVTYATNMLKQSILVQGSEIPRVYTSMYRDCFASSNTFLIRAKKDGTVLGVPTGQLILLYDDGEEEVIEISETSVTSDSVNFLNFKVKEDDRFRKGDILVDSAISKNGIYSPGVNALVAYIADGWEYEDAVKPSESLAVRCTSISADTVKHIVRRSSGYSVRVGRENFFKFIPEDGVIAPISRIDRSDKRRETSDVIRASKASGILYSIERSVDAKKHTEYKCQLLGFNKLQTGDKIAGRHSNKGTISRVTPDSEMPMFKNGVPVQMLLNPCGVPSRMNIGQLSEAYLGFVADLLDIHVQSNPFNGASHEEIKLLMHYVYDLANTSNPEVVFPKYRQIPDEVHEIARKRHAEIREWEGCFLPNGTAYLWNPETGKYLENPVAFGVAYILKLEHEVDDKVHSRGGLLEEEYSMTTKQPTEGAARGGGQKMGEMEFMALAAYGANAVIEETANASSDGIEAKTNQTLDSLGLQNKMVAGDMLPHSVYQLMYYLEAAGIKMYGTEGELPDVSYETSKSRKTLDIVQMMANRQEKTEDLRDSLRSLREE